jgi:hypothetical protein
MLAYLACVEQTASAFAQFGLPRSGLYAVAAWLAHGVGGNLKCIEGGWIDQIDAGKLVTIEAVRPEFVIEGLARCRSLGGVGFIQLRDPYNWLASLDEGLATRAVVWKGTDPPLHRWLQYAQLCRSEEWLDYHRWFADAEYRRTCAERFAFQQNRDGAPWQGVPKRGGGSSFDGTQFAGRADEMKVGERWRRFENDARWRAQFDDEIVSLTRELFGMERPW